VYFLWFLFWREIVKPCDRFAGVMHLGSVDAIVGDDPVHLEDVHRVDLVVALREDVVL
jgi:hypothetical protein